MKLVSKHPFFFVKALEKFILKNNTATYLCNHEKTMCDKGGVSN
jgi:hypothetical protein